MNFSAKNTINGDVSRITAKRKEENKSIEARRIALKNFAIFFFKIWGCRNKVQWNRVHGNKVHVFFIARIRSMSKFYTF